MNETLVRTAIGAYLQGDESLLHDVVSPEVTVTTRPDQPDVRDYHGHDGLFQALSDWIDAWDDYTFEITRLSSVGEFVLATARQGGRGKSSGVPIDDDVVFVFTIDDGRISRLQMFATEAEAQMAVGAGR